MNSYCANDKGIQWSQILLNTSFFYLRILWKVLCVAYTNDMGKGTLVFITYIAVFLILAYYKKHLRSGRTKWTMEPRTILLKLPVRWRQFYCDCYCCSHLKAPKSFYHSSEMFIDFVKNSRINSGARPHICFYQFR